MTQDSRPTLVAVPARVGLLQQLRTWSPRRWVVAAVGAVATVLVVAVPTDLIDTPWFTRDVPPTAWAWPVLLLNALLAGLVAATYVAPPETKGPDRGGRLGAVGGFATFFAVGCPVCNKLVLLALGYGGAMQYFQPVQPYLAATSVIVLGWALGVRVRREASCPLPAAATAEPSTAAPSGEVR